MDWHHMDIPALLNQIDRESVLFLNSFVGEGKLEDKFIDAIGQNAFVRGFPIFFSLVVLWFLGNDKKRQARIAAGLLASFIAVVFSIATQHHIFVHTRPFLDETLNLKLYDPSIASNWDRLSSFPSDTGMLFFSLCTVIFLESRVAGSIALLWSLVTVGATRVLIGFHYPSDILGSLVLGPGFVFVIGMNKYVIVCFERILQQFQNREYIVHGLFFIALAEAYSLFIGLRHILNGVLMIGKRVIDLF
jgi:membrane-associated phospholipid phosphatase